MPNKEITHYGVPGMKWGVRKTRSSSKAKKKTSASSKKLTSEELKKEVERLELERRYSALVAQSKSTSVSARGKKFVGSILADSVKKTATAVISKQLSDVLNSALTKN